MGVLRGVFRIIALQSFLDRPSGVLMSQEGFGCCWFPLNGRGILLFLIHSLLSVPPPPQLKCLSIISSGSSTT